MAFNNYPYNNYTPQTYTPLIFVNGIEGAKTYIISGFNQVAYLKDMDSDLLFVKSSDAMGKVYLKAYKLNEVNLDEISGYKPNQNTSFVPQDLFNKTINDLEGKLNRVLDILTPKESVKENKNASKQ